MKFNRETGGLLENLEGLISQNGWHLHFWESRYGSGVFGMVALTTYVINEIYDISTGADIEACEFEFYIKDEGSWLPVVKGDSIKHVLEELNKKVVLNNNVWSNAVSGAYECIIEKNDGNYGLRVAIDEKVPFLFKPTNL